MKKISLTIILTTIALGNPAFARNDAVYVPFDEVVQLGTSEGKLDGSVKFYLAGASTPKVQKKLQTDTSNKKTNAFGKDDQTACKWAALSALIAFQNKAKTLGANAVIDMVSYNNKVQYKDPARIECRAGNVMAGVALRGTYAQTQ